jgi:phosphoadenosine phosphosulfate reductase
LLVENTLFGTVNKVDLAINRIRYANELAKGRNKNLILGFSGGKDSTTIYYLCKMAKVNFQAFHAPTPEFKETMQYIRQFDDVIQVKPKIWTRSNNPKFNGKQKTMFNLIANRKIPPTRQHPYCCSSLKENVGQAGDFVVLGVRAEESSKRNDRKVINMFNGKICVNPIVDWLECDVWEFIKQYKLPYNPLYDMGHCRVGCPGCPKSNNQKQELEENPRWKNFYLIAFKHMLKNIDSSENKKFSWETPQDVYNWWIGECVNQRQELDGQCEFM